MQGYVQGDLDPSLPMTVEVNGVGVDLSTALSVQLRWLKPDGTLLTVPLTITSATTGMVLRTWSAGDTDEIGYHQGQIVVTWGDNTTQTFPNNGQPIYWAVFSDVP